MHLNVLTADFKGFGNLGASSCAPSVSIIKMGFLGSESDDNNSSKSYAWVKAVEESCFPLRILKIAEIDF